jgi:drug/metabolite transporter (DMT)-like permease
VAIFSNLQPLATALLARSFLGEPVTLAFYGAALVVIFGVVLAQTSSSAATSVQPQPQR